MTVLPNGNVGVGTTTQCHAHSQRHGARLGDAFASTVDATQYNLEADKYFVSTTMSFTLRTGLFTTSALAQACGFQLEVVSQFNRAFAWERCRQAAELVRGWLR
jgi:hypothetical protein